LHHVAVETAIAQAVFELDPFGLRADQAEVGEVVALEDRGGQFQVELWLWVMTMQ
jgi:hypothetical protein